MKAQRKTPCFVLTSIQVRSHNSSFSPLSRLWNGRKEVWDYCNCEVSARYALAFDPSHWTRRNAFHELVLRDTKWAFKSGASGEFTRFFEPLEGDSDPFMVSSLFTSLISFTSCNALPIHLLPTPPLRMNVCKASQPNSLSRTECLVIFRMCVSNLKIKSEKACGTTAEKAHITYLLLRWMSSRRGEAARWVFGAKTC